MSLMGKAANGGWGWMLLFNLLCFGKWTTCRHRNVEPVGFGDWRCKDCGAET